MRIMSFSAASYCALALLVGGCNEPSARLLGAPAPERAAHRRAVVLDDAAFRALLGSASRISPDSVKLRETIALLDPQSSGVPRAEVADEDPNDPSTWPSAHIQRWNVEAVIGPPLTYAYGFMSHNGHIGEVTLRAALHNETGVAVQSFGPESKSELNLFGPLLYDGVQLSVQMQPPSDCGNSINASGGFRAYYIALPLPTKIGGWTLPTIRFGETRKTDSGGDSQEPCPTVQPPGDDTGDTGDAGDTGAGDGGYYSEVCLYYDWYFPDGTYWYTETVDCWLVYTTVNDT
ncbi:MAG: hypothetical protein A2085_09405 [Gemmatimonadetes bacterium GWC2_71_10]|nr:MAG: hypothetical protein A2085_09405 [Gemmatimonadetes bacterium GWC2_71_10]